MSISFIIDIGIFLLSSILAVSLAIGTRQNYLLAANHAATDWLTGLLNRRGFETIANMEIARQKRYGGVFSLALIDLDNFKTLNDTRGHLVGDAVLKLLADILHQHTRESDIVARIGGDEFVILMPNTQIDDCGWFCQQLAKKIAKRMAEEDFTITASIGYAPAGTAPESMSDILRLADKAMYAAKESGKGCVVGN